jgi:hypothetical protein
MTNRFETIGSGITSLFPEPGECICRAVGREQQAVICNSCGGWWCDTCTPFAQCPFGPAHDPADIKR